MTSDHDEGWVRRWLMRPLFALENLSQWGGRGFRGMDLVERRSSAYPFSSCGSAPFLGFVSFRSLILLILHASARQVDSQHSFPMRHKELWTA